MTETHIDTTAIEQSVVTASDRADAIIIVDEKTQHEAAEFLRAVKTLLKRVADTFDEPIKAAHAAHKSMVAARKKHETPLLEIEATVKRKIGAYHAEQTRIRLAQEAALRRAAQEAEEERRLAEAARLEGEGRNVEAEQIIAAPPSPVIAVIPAPPTPEGITTRTAWKYEVVDENVIPRQYLMVNTVAIGAAVRSLKGATNIPGVCVWSEQSVSATGY